jgi:hypothetical protein
MRGQALVEYALVTSTVVLVVLYGVGIEVAPGKSILAILFDALAAHFESWAYLLSLPLP